MTINALFFDFGNVLAFFDHHKACRQIARLSNGGYSQEQIYTTLFQPDGLENHYDRGEISSDGFLKQIKVTFNLQAAAIEIEQAWSDIFTLNEDMIDLLHSLKSRGYPLFLASNTNHLHYKWISEVFARELNLFKEHILSFRIGFRKPEQGFFDHCVKKSGLPASQCFFTDDRVDFVQAARQAGMKAVQFTTCSNLVRELNRLGVKTGL